MHGIRGGAVMKLTWELLTEPPAEPHWTEEHPAPRFALRCGCGRFAKWVGDQHYYNGNYNCYRYTIRCSRCGDVDIECV